MKSIVRMLPDAGRFTKTYRHTKPDHDRFSLHADSWAHVLVLNDEPEDVDQPKSHGSSTALKLLIHNKRFIVNMVGSRAV